MKAEASSENQGSRLDLFLISKFPSLSRSQFKLLLNEGRVKVNDEVEFKPHYRMKSGDKIEVEDTVIARKHIAATSMKLDVIYEDDNCVAINKPSGLKVHPTFYNEASTLLNGLYSQFAHKLTDYGVVLVNRIDADTSGIVLACFNPSAAWYYSKEFASNSAKKEYLAEVSPKWVSEFGKEETEISNKLRYIGRVAVVSQEGEFAATKFQFLKYAKNGNAIIKAKPLTGRTHQIRVHLAELGFPIVGDTKYNGVEFSRLMLHAWKLQLHKYPSEELITFEAPVPELFS